MRRRALLMGGKEQKPLIIRVSTSISGATPNDTFRISANAPGETYNYKVDWGDGVITSNHTGNAEHTYSSPGVKDIKIYGKFPRFYFNGGGDRRKLLSVLDWGDINYSTNQDRAFYGCENLSFIATDDNGWYNGITDGRNTFYNSSLTDLPDNMTLSSLTNGGNMFINNSLTSLPSAMTLSSLTIGQAMFQNNSLTSLPYGMTLSNLTSGTQMFLNNSLTSLPGEMELPLLTNGYRMFEGNSITFISPGMDLPNLTNGERMFSGNSLTTLPTGMELPLLTNGQSMFRNNPITSAFGLKLHNINSGALFMLGANLPVSQYSNILVEIEANNPNDNVTIHFGSSKYNTTGAIAKRELLNRGWTITDGGLE